MIKKSKITSKQMLISGMILLSILAVGDMVSTYIAISRGGFEGNPLPRYVITHLGWTFACISKAVQIGIICWLFTITYRKNKVTTLAALWMTVGMSFITVANNIAIIYSYWL